MLESQFNQLYEKYHTELFQFLFYMVNNREQAEDLVQEVYIKILKSYDRFERKSSEKTWMFSIARNVAIDSFRKKKSLKEQFFDNFYMNVNDLNDYNLLPEEVAMTKEEIKQVYRSLQCCSVEQRMVIHYRYIQGFSIADTAAALGWSASKVKTTQHRGIKKLRKHYQERVKFSLFCNGYQLNSTD